MQHRKGSVLLPLPPSRLDAKSAPGSSVANGSYPQASSQWTNTSSAVNVQTSASGHWWITPQRTSPLLESAIQTGMDERIRNVIRHARPGNYISIGVQ